MSIETWKEEFYDANFAKEMAAEQSLKKWVGLRPENLAKHEVTKKRNYIADDGFNAFSITGSTCSLCRFYYYWSSYDACSACPLYKLTGKACDDNDSQYSYWCDTGDPEPMIKALSEIVQ